MVISVKKLVSVGLLTCLPLSALAISDLSPLAARSAVDTLTNNQLAQTLANKSTAAPKITCPEKLSCNRYSCEQPEMQRGFLSYQGTFGRKTTGNFHFNQIMLSTSGSMQTVKCFYRNGNRSLYIVYTYSGSRLVVPTYSQSRSTPCRGSANSCAVMLR